MTSRPVAVNERTPAVLPMESSLTSALTQIDRHISIYAEDPDWQRTWLNIEAEAWRSIAFVPTSEHSSLDLVHGLAAIAWQQRGTPLIVADLRSIGLSALTGARSELRRRIDCGDRVLIATQALDKNPTTASIVREADKVILCVFCGDTRRGQIRSALRELGPGRCLGTILVRSNGKKPG